MSLKAVGRMAILPQLGAIGNATPVPAIAKIHTPKLAHAEDAADFVMEVRENGNAGV
jgi:hypothetical protein